MRDASATATTRTATMPFVESLSTSRMSDASSGTDDHSSLHYSSTERKSMGMRVCSRPLVPGLCRKASFFAAQVPALTLSRSVSRCEGASDRLCNLHPLPRQVAGLVSRGAVVLGRGALGLHVRIFESTVWHAVDILLGRSSSFSLGRPYLVAFQGQAA